MSKPGRTLCGIDEAGLGPKLGPFCAVLTHFSVPDIPPQQDRELYSLLEGIVSASKDAPLWIADSKSIYTGKNKIATLEHHVLPMLQLAGLSLPCSFENFLKWLCPDKDFTALAQRPWFGKASRLEIPSIGRTRLKERFTQAGVRIHRPVMRVICPASFNDMLDTTGGKGDTVLLVLGDLLRQAMEILPSSSPEKDFMRLSIDRLGGRRYYSNWLESWCGQGSIQKIKEEARHSMYRGYNIEFHFLVRGDSQRLEIAWASMIGKYTRELCMRLFNEWWCSRMPGLKPTAGYPPDAGRFIADLKKRGYWPADEINWVRRL